MNRITYFTFSLLFGLSLQGLSQFGFTRTNGIVVKSDGVDAYTNAWAGGLDFAQFSNIDLNFDGENDLFVFDRTCDKVLTFVHTGGPGSEEFVYAPEYESIFPAMKSWALLVDYNCDGLEDIFTYTLGTAKVYRNTGNSTDGHQFVVESAYLRTLTWTSEVYMYFASNDVPAFIDIDGDNDIDVLTFGVGGLSIEYHKNMSVENYGVCDSLEFITENLCWGRFRESGSTNEVTLWDTLVYPCNGAYPSPESIRPWGMEDRHTGSTVLALDLNGNGVMDLILGDVAYNNLVMLMNTGSAPNMNSGMGSQDITYPSSSVPVDLEIFPASFYVDIDDDGVRDLLVGTNTPIGSMNYKSVWSYHNAGADDYPDFVFEQEDFLQEEMIETGTGSLPVLFDHNGDGLKDLLVSQHQRYNSVTGLYEGRIYYFENTGTSVLPEFTFITDDYLNFSTLNVGSGLSYYPCFGDLDNDGDEDMIVGDYHGYCYIFENTAGVGSPAAFSSFDTLRNSLGVPIFHSTYAYPTLVDLDRDNDLDLAIGRRTGKVQYFENTGDASLFQFEHQTDNLGMVDVSEYWTIEGQAVPVFLDIEGEYNLVLGSKSGYLHFYDNIEGNISGAFALVDSTLDNLNVGTWSAPAIADLNDDYKYDLILGNQRGGLALYSSGIISNIGLEERNEIAFNLYPNPTHDQFTIYFNELDFKSMTPNSITLVDLTGRMIQEIGVVANKISVSTEGLTPGIYFVVVTNRSGITAKRITIQ